MVLAGFFGVRVMQMSEFDPQKLEMGRPRCEKCGTLMWLARIEPDSRNHDKRTFECSVCEATITKVVKYK